ncbi:MAG: hypothetical protein HKN47_00065 [Pirellulaceae bacterium]|nr:hypothetical protein [Pirellulaceae bacterium]
MQCSNCFAPIDEDDHSVCPFCYNKLQGDFTDLNAAQLSLLCLAGLVTLNVVAFFVFRTDLSMASLILTPQ